MTIKELNTELQKINSKICCIRISDNRGDIFLLTYNDYPRIYETRRVMVDSIDAISMDKWNSEAYKLLVQVEEIFQIEIGGGRYV